MANARINTHLGMIVKAVRDKLEDEGIFTDCYVSLTASRLHTPATDQYAIVSPGRQELDMGSIAGGGRDYVFVKGRLVVTIWNRLILDEADKDDLYLTDNSLGALEKLRQTINALTMFDPQDETPDYILGEPMRFYSIEVPEKTNIPGWGYVQGVWECNYTQSLLP